MKRNCVADQYPAKRPPKAPGLALLAQALYWGGLRHQGPKGGPMSTHCLPDCPQLRVASVRRASCWLQERGEDMGGAGDGEKHSVLFLIRTAGRKNLIFIKVPPPPRMPTLPGELITRPGPAPPRLLARAGMHEAPSASARAEGGVSLPGGAVVQPLNSDNPACQATSFLPEHRI